MVKPNRPRSHFRPTVAVAWFLVAAVAAAAARGEVVVEKKPPTVEFKTFDPAHPPKADPHLRKGDVAVTVAEFPFEAKLGVEATQRVLPNDKSMVTYRVKRVTVTLSLSVIVFLPDNATDAAKAHQAGHRQIVEQAYARAEAAARQAAAKVDGRVAAGQAANVEAAEKTANEGVIALNAQLNLAYRELLVAPTTRTREIYDELTDRGAKATPDPAAAVKLAVQRQAAEAKAPKPANRPAATRPAATKPASSPATRPAAGR